MLADMFILALKNVRKRGIRSWLTMLGVFVGIAAVVSLISLGQGLETAVTGQFGALSTDTLMIQGADTGFSPPGSTSVRKMSKHDLEIIEEVPGIETTIPRLLRVANVEYNDILGFSFTGSMPDDKKQIEEIYDSLNVKVEQGRLLKDGDKGEIVLGNDFVRSDVYGKEIRLGSTLKVEGGNFVVVGILQRSSTFTLNGAIFMMEDDMRRIYGISDEEIDFLVAKVEDENKIESVAEEIEKRIRRDRHQKKGQEDFEVQTPLQGLETVQTIISVINIVVAGIALIALLVGGIGITNTMFTSVLERTKEIGVMKAIGAKNSDVLLLFLIESGLLGLIGGLVGAGIGLSMALIVSQLANSALGDVIFKVAPSISLLLSSVSFSLIIGIFSGLVPAYQASKLNPVEALRK